MCTDRAWEEDLADWHGHVCPIDSTQDAALARIEWEEDKAALAALVSSALYLFAGGVSLLYPVPLWTQSRADKHGWEEDLGGPIAGTPRLPLPTWHTAHGSGFKGTKLLRRLRELRGLDPNMWGVAPVALS